MAELATGPVQFGLPRATTRNIRPLAAHILSVLFAFGQHPQGLGRLSAGLCRTHPSNTRPFTCWTETNPGSLLFAPQRLTTLMLTRSLVRLALPRLKPASIDRAPGGLKRFYTWAQRVGLACGDPTRSAPFMRLMAAPALMLARKLTDLKESALAHRVAQCLLDTTALSQCLDRPPVRTRSDRVALKTVQGPDA